MAESGHKPTRSSPLTGLAAPAAGITLAERPYVAKVNLRGDPGDKAFTSAVEPVLGGAPPVTPNTVTETDDWRVFWLGPNEWLVHGADGRQRQLVGALREGLSGIHSAVTDVSDYYVVIRLTGDKAREVLTKGSPLDVHPRSFLPGSCAQTRFGHASILLHHADDSPIFDIQVRWTFAEYLWNYLVDAAAEYA